MHRRKKRRTHPQHSAPKPRGWIVVRKHQRFRVRHAHIREFRLELMMTQPVLKLIFISLVPLKIYAKPRLVRVQKTQAVVVKPSVFAHVASRVQVVLVRIFPGVRDEKSLQVRKRIPKEEERDGREKEERETSTQGFASRRHSFFMS
jgi:hypothetical protein